MKYRDSATLVVSLMVLSCGAACHALHQKPSHAIVSKDSATHPKGYIVEVNEPIKSSPKSYYCVGKITHIYTHQNSFTPIDCNLNIRFWKDSVGYTWNPYERYRLLLLKAPDSIRATVSAVGGFDARGYYARKNITYQVFVSSQEYRILDSSPQPKWSQVLLHTETYVRESLQKYVTSKEVYGLLEALLIGYKQDLDKQVLSHYLLSGTIHIIAISGLHIGFLYWFLSYVVLKKMSSTRTKRIIKCVLILCMLSFYSILAGAGASILRATLMFSIIALGEVWQRRASTLNLLAASAFLLLCYNTQILFDLGFILSYTAVLSLLLFQQRLYAFAAPRRQAVRVVYTLVVSTLAAQILILPLIAYLNHYIPTYFLFNNLFAIPLSSFVLVLSLLLVICAPIPLLSTYVSKLCTLTVWVMNGLLSTSNKLPLSRIYVPDFDRMVVLLYYLSVVLVCAYFLSQKKKWMWLSLGTILVVSIHQCVHRIERKKQVHLILFPQTHQNILSIIQGTKALIYTDDSLSKALYLSLIQPSMFSFGVQEDTLIVSTQNRYFVLKDKRIVYLRDPTRTNIASTLMQHPIVIDYLLIHRCYLPHLSQLLRLFEVKCIVLDNSCSAYQVHQYLPIPPPKLRIHLVKRDGVFVW